MEFSTSVIIFATWIIAAFAVARYFAAMGHSKTVSYSTGVVMGLVAAALVYFINAPRVQQQRQLADLDSTATAEQTSEEKTDPAPTASPQEKIQPEAQVPAQEQAQPETQASTNDGAAPPSPEPVAAGDADKQLDEEMEKAAKEMSSGAEEKTPPPAPPSQKQSAAAVPMTSNAPSTATLAPPSQKKPAAKEPPASLASYMAAGRTSAQKKPAAAEPTPPPTPTPTEPPKASEQVAAVAKPAPSEPFATPELKPEAKPEPPMAPTTPEPKPEAKLEPPAAPAPPEPKPAAKPEPPRGPFELSLTATAKEVWVRVSADGAPVQTRRLQEGQSFSWKAKRGFVVTADNAGGLRASLNGKALPRLGREGQSRANIRIP